MISPKLNSKSIILEDLTIIITTFNRYSYLKRLLKYFEAMKYRGQIIVADSSAIDLEDSELKHILQTPNVKWLKFDPDYFCVKKVTDVCSFVSTKYVTLL